MLAIRAERAFDGERLVRGGVVVLLDQGRIVEWGGMPRPCPPMRAWSTSRLPRCFPDWLTPTSTSAVTAARGPSIGSPGTTTRGWPG